ncbi:uncharacterized protein LOC126661577 [Mercurialis annua]|uniref:uncharacterized protein LOC126661577 n=1 Tax=Mercurialis annua TaxID=3986 RepID=UPI00215F21B9|nr:uncharacterized protein LOC126661577 [Mercurialis annua]
MDYENYDPSFPDQPVADLYIPVWASLPAFGSKPAFIWVEDGSPSARSVLTYSQLNESVESISSHLLVPLVRSDTVVILCPPGLQLIELIFGCQRAGLSCIPICPPNPSFNDQSYHHFVRVLSQTKPKAAIATCDYIASVQRYTFSVSSTSTDDNKLVKLLQQLRWISTSDLKEKNKSSSSSYNGCSTNEVYLIQYTSGATGIPKPVIVTAGSAVHNVRVARKAYDLHPNSVIVSWLPQYHDCGLQFLLLTIISGATCILTSPAAFLSRPRLWLELITEFKGTCTPVPSFTLPLVVKRGGVGNALTRFLNLWSLRNLILINEPIYKSSVEEFVNMFKPFGLNPSCISPSYGLAENCTFVSTAWSKNKNNNFAYFPSYNKLLPIAKLNSQNDHQDDEEEEDMEILVVNEDSHEPVSDGTEGEIWVSSPSNCSGYLGHPSLTREIFQARLNNSVRRCFVRTGDRGIIKGEERYLYVTGRCSDVIKLKNGEEIHPHYIETAAYKSCPKFLRGGCLAALEISNTITIVAEMQRSEKDSEALKKICERIKKGVMEEERVEVGLVVLVKSGDLPKTTSGKIQRWAAKNKLIGAKMSVVMEAVFNNNTGDNVRLSPFAGENKIKEKEGRRIIGFGSLSDTVTRPSLHSHL